MLHFPFLPPHVSHLWPVSLMCLYFPASLTWDTNMKAVKQKVVESKTISRGVLEFLSNPSKPLLPIFVVTSRLFFSLSLWSIFLTYCLNKKSSVCSSEPNRTKEPPGGLFRSTVMMIRALENHIWRTKSIKIQYPSHSEKIHICL